MKVLVLDYEIVLLLADHNEIGKLDRVDTEVRCKLGVESDHILFDLIYNPAKTLFLERGEQQGAKVLSGDEMFRRQAEASWEIWNR